ncbi:MAG: hypothetical protein ACOH2H_14545 [Cypionkella sp.]
MRIMTLNDTNDLPLLNLQALIARHGTLSVGFAYLRAALARRPHPPDIDVEFLSDHLLRDLGIESWRPMNKSGRQGWDI